MVILPSLELPAFVVWTVHSCAYSPIVMSTTPNCKKAHFVPTIKKGAKLFLDCFDAVREHKQYWNKWIAADSWMDIIKDRYDNTANLKFVAADSKRAIGRHPKSSSIDTIGNTNVHRLYKATYFEQKKI
jgi:hypothetical protein